MAKLTKLEQAAVDMLPEIAAATQAGSYVFKSAFDIAYLIENGLVEQNEEMMDNGVDGDTYATRTTVAGNEFVAINCVEKVICNVPTEIPVFVETAPAEITVEEPKPERKIKMSFEIETGIEVPKTTRGGARTSAYPFESLRDPIKREDGSFDYASFFIPASEKHPEPEKSLASTVSGATKRYDVLVPGETKEVRNPKTQEVKTVPKTAHARVFILRAGEKDGIKGARVFRTV